MCKSYYRDATIGLLALVLAAQPACTVRPEAYEIDGTDLELVFLHSSDIHSRLLPYEMDVMLTDENLGLDPKNAPFGGIARLSALVRQTRKDFGRVAYVETGDVFQGAPIFNSFGGEPEFRALSQMGVDVFSIGNHEFDNGTAHLVNQALRFASFPMVAANYAMSDPSFDTNIPTGKLASPYTIVNMKGLRVGVIGLGYVGGHPYYGGATEGVIPLKNQEVLQSYVDYLRPIVDLVAVVSHAGYHDDLEYIPRTEGIDIFFGGHLHIALDPPNVLQDCDIAKLQRERDLFKCDTPEKLKAAEQSCQDKTCLKKSAADKPQCIKDCVDQAKAECKREAATHRYAQRIVELNKDIAFLTKRGCHPRNVLLVHSGAFLKFIGRLQTTVRQCHRIPEKVCMERDASNTCLKWVPRRCVGNQSAQNDWEVVSHNYRLIPIDKNLPEDPQMLQLLEPFVLELHRQQRLTHVHGYTSRRFYRFSKGTGDSELGNLVTTGMMVRDQVWADLALTNSLGIRSDIVAGPVTEEQLVNVFPFENSITVMYLSGYEVQEMFDFIAQRSASRGCQSQAQVSGVTATLNCGGCPGNGGNTCLRQSYDGEACAQRITIGGSGRACAADKDCVTDSHGKPTGEICTSQKHPDPAMSKAGKGYRCWLPISCTRTYRLATNDYIAHGGSGFTVLARNTTQKNLYIPLRESTKDYIAQIPACSQVPQTFSQKVSGAALEYVLDETDRQRLKRMEAAALRRDLSGADSDYKKLLAELDARRKVLDGKIVSTADGSEAELKLLNQRKGITNYLGCVSEDPDNNGQCIGLACWQIKDCTAAKDGASCKSLARIRAALRCITLPCVDASEDGRLDRIFRDASGPPHTDPDYPG